MNDITKCTNKDCDLKMNCKRWLDADGDMQSYAYFEPIEGECEYFWEAQ